MLLDTGAEMHDHSTHRPVRLPVHYATAAVIPGVSFAEARTEVVTVGLKSQFPASLNFSRSADSAPPVRCGLQWRGRCLCAGAGGSGARQRRRRSWGTRSALDSRPAARCRRRLRPATRTWPGGDPTAPQAPRHQGAPAGTFSHAPPELLLRARR